MGVIHSPGYIGNAYVNLAKMPGKSSLELAKPPNKPYRTGQSEKPVPPMYKPPVGALDRSKLRPETLAYLLAKESEDPITRYNARIARKSTGAVTEIPPPKKPEPDQ